MTDSEEEGVQPLTEAETRRVLACVYPTRLESLLWRVGAVGSRLHLHRFSDWADGTAIRRAHDRADRGEWLGTGRWF